MRSENISNRGILDATLVVAYFYFVNRIVLALGLEASEAEMKDTTMIKQVNFHPPGIF